MANCPLPPYSVYEVLRESTDMGVGGVRVWRKEVRGEEVRGEGGRG